MEEYNHDSDLQGWRKKVLIVGAVVGAAVGFGAAYLYTQQAEDPVHKPDFSTGDGVKLGVLLLGLLRQVSELGSGGK
jgi:hypothetical protein